MPTETYVPAAVSLAFPSLTRDDPLKPCYRASCAAGADLQSQSWKAKMRVKETCNTYKMLMENYFSVTNLEIWEMEG